MSENIHDPPIQIRNLCTKNHVFMINKITHVDMLKLFNSHRKLLIAQSPCDRKKYSNQEFKFSRVRIFPGWPTGFQFSITGCYDLVIYFTGNSTHLLKQRETARFCLNKGKLRKSCLITNAQELPSTHFEN